ncbi:MAG: hydrogen peroxide-dependent heme synthase [Terrimesophilobacter sp.]
MTLPVEPVAPAPSDPSYTLWAVLRRDPGTTLSESDLRAGVQELDAAVTSVEATGVTLRGIYDVSGLKSDADIMIWLHGGAPEAIQSALRALRRTAMFSSLLPTWNVMGVHRDAEFTADHRPSYLRGVDAGRWLTVYPFVRTHEWYLLPDEERRGMLARHGKMGRDFPEVKPNTVAAFALGDYEWILALESEELVSLVDLMRKLRQADARLHVREEIPFYTGRRIDTGEIPEVLT